MKEKIDPKALPLATRITKGRGAGQIGWATLSVLQTFWRIEGHPGLYTCRSKPPSGFAYVVAAYEICSDKKVLKLGWSKFVRETTVEKILGLK